MRGHLPTWRRVLQSFLCVLRQARDEERFFAALPDAISNDPHPELVEGRTIELQPSAGRRLLTPAR